MNKKIIALIILTVLALTGCSSPSSQDLAKLDKSKKLATEWLRLNFRDKGLWQYIYKPKQNTYPNSNNALRQLMASRLAAELAQTNIIFKNIHKSNLNFIFEYWYKEKDDKGYIFYSDKSKIGANAMLLRTLAHSPFYEDYKEQAAKTANGIISLINKDGSIKPWFVEPDYNYDSDYLMTFYSGEALLALLEYYEVSQKPEILEAAQKSQDYYIKEYIDEMDQNYYPAYVPWHTQSLAKLFKITNDKKYADAIFALNDKLLEIQDTTEHIGRFYNPQTPEYGNPHSASDSVFTEGLAYAYEIATKVGDKAHQEKYQEAILLGLENLYSLQYCNGADHKYYPKLKVCGALKYRINDDRIRIDTTQHTLDAILQIERIWK